VGQTETQPNIDILHIKELMGHKSIKMSMRYAHLNTENLRHAITALENRYNIATVDKNEIAVNASNALK
jgi:hypothetical protein